MSTAICRFCAKEISPPVFSGPELLMPRWVLRFIFPRECLNLEHRKHYRWNSDLIPPDYEEVD